MSRRTQLICLAVTALIMAGVQWYFRPPAEVPLPSAAVAQFYVYCPKCGLEMTCPAEQAEKPPFCPHCGPSRPMQVSTVSRGSAQASATPTNWFIVAAALGIPITLAICVYLLGRPGQPVIVSQADEAYRFNCPGCGHEMSSTSYRKGSTAVCPVCSELFVVTGTDTPKTEDRRREESSDLEAGLRSRLRKQSRDKRRRPR
jgi:uncharacterized paraquat-inducible protein A